MVSYGCVAFLLEESVWALLTDMPLGCSDPWRLRAPQCTILYLPVLFLAQANVSRHK